MRLGAARTGTVRTTFGGSANDAGGDNVHVKCAWIMVTAADGIVNRGGAGNFAELRTPSCALATVREQAAIAAAASQAPEKHGGRQRTNPSPSTFLRF